MGESRLRLAVLADIHGNLPALEAVLADAAAQGVDGILFAGDLAFGPQTAEVTARLRDAGAWMVRGNNEDHLLALDTADPQDPRRRLRQWAVLRWQRQQLDEATLAYMASLPSQQVIDLPGTAPIRVVHGSPREPAEKTIPDRDPVAREHLRRADLLPVDGRGSAAVMLREVEEPVLVCGHTHIPWQQREDGRLALNPGSAGAPLNADPRAHYCLLAWEGRRWQATQRAVPYDLTLLRQAYQESGLLAEGGAFARAALLWVESGLNVTGHLLEHARRLAVEAGCGRCATVPDEVWERSVESFSWPGGRPGPEASG